MPGEHNMVLKCVFCQPSMRVPVIVRPPGGTGPRTVNDLVEDRHLVATRPVEDD